MRSSFANKISRLVVCATFLLSPLAGKAAESPSIPLIVTLRPAGADAQQRVPYVDVTLTYAIPPLAARPADPENGTRHFECGDRCKDDRGTFHQ